MENKEVVKENVEQKYTFGEQRLMVHADRNFEIANSMINSARNLLSDAWEVKVEYDKSLAYTNPYKKFIEMLEWYIKDSNELYAKYMKEHGFKLTKENRKDLNDVKSREDQNKPAQPIALKQVNQLKLG